MQILINDNNSIDVKDIRNTEQGDKVNLIIELIDMFEEYIQYHEGARPGTVTELIEWYDKKDLPFS